MKHNLSLITVLLLSLPVAAFAQGSGGMHDGHGGGGGGSSSCKKLTLDKSKLNPKHLAEVKPGAALSFIAAGIDKPENLAVTVKQLPIAISTEDKGSFYRVQGKVPAELSNTVARVNVKLKGRGNCLSQDGWLIKITE